jgi:hypothetical protein
VGVYLQGYRQTISELEKNNVEITCSFRLAKQWKGPRAELTDDFIVVVDVADKNRMETSGPVILRAFFLISGFTPLECHFTDVTSCLPIHTILWEVGGDSS